MLKLSDEQWFCPKVASPESTVLECKAMKKKVSGTGLTFGVPDPKANCEFLPIWDLGDSRAVHYQWVSPGWQASISPPDHGKLRPGLRAIQSLPGRAFSSSWPVRKEEKSRKPHRGAAVAATPGTSPSGPCRRPRTARTSPSLGTRLERLLKKHYCATALEFHEDFKRNLDDALFS